MNSICTKADLGSSGLQLPRVECKGVRHCIQVTGRWGSNPGLCVCWASTLLTEPHPQSHSGDLKKMVQKFLVLLRSLVAMHLWVPRERTVNCFPRSLCFLFFPKCSAVLAYMSVTRFEFIFVCGSEGLTSFLQLITELPCVVC